jgi:hypothetical protein
MTLTSDFMDVKTPISEQVAKTDGSRLILRSLQRLVGFSLALTAAALWIAPGSSWDADVMLFKLILSMTSIIAGLGLMHASARPAPPEIEIDTIRREVRLMRRSRTEGSTVLSRSSFAELGKVEHDGPCIRLWDANMALIAEVTLHDRDARRSLLGGLRDEGKLE